MGWGSGGGSLGTWEQEGPGVVRDALRLAESVEKIAAAVAKMQTDTIPAINKELAVMNERGKPRDLGIFGRIMMAVATAAVIAAGGSALWLWSDVRLALRDIALNERELESQRRSIEDLRERVHELHGPPHAPGSSH